MCVLVLLEQLVASLLPPSWYIQERSLTFACRGWVLNPRPISTRNLLNPRPRFSKEYKAKPSRDGQNNV